MKIKSESKNKKGKQKRKMGKRKSEKKGNIKITYF